MKNPDDWKSFLYDSYVSSGQAKKSTATVASEHFSSSKPFIDRIAKNDIPDSRSTRIVDLACGQGDAIYHLKEKGYLDIVGVDISPEQVAVAHQFGLTEVRNDTIENFLKEASSVDVVLLLDILEHLTTGESLSLLKAVHSCLSDDGIVVIHVPNAEGLFGMRIRYGDLTHEIAFTPRSMRQLLLACGFNQIKIREDVPMVHGVLSFFRYILWKIGTIPCRILLAAETGSKTAVLSQNMTVTARKSK